MALCVVLKANGSINSVTPFTGQTCDFVALTGTEANSLAELLNGSMATISALFQPVPAVDIQSAFMAGVSLPLLAYLISWGYGIVINFASRD